MGHLQIPTGEVQCMQTDFTREAETGNTAILSHYSDSASEL